MRAPSSTRLASLVYGFAEGLATQITAGRVTQTHAEVPSACVWVSDARNSSGVAAPTSGFLTG
jgi:hypothetical protein